MLDCNKFNEEQFLKIKDFYEFYDKNRINKFNQRYVERRLSYFDRVREIYFKIIDKTCNLINELEIKSIEDISVIYEYLVWNGYLSHDKEFYYSIGGRHNITGMLGADILCGKGVCLNVSSMLVDIFKKLNYESYLVGVKLLDTKYTCSYVPDIERKILNDDVYTTGNSSKTMHQRDKELLPQIRANHSIAVVKDKFFYKYIDAHNLLFGENSNILEVKYIGTSPSCVQVIPYVTLLNECMLYSEFLNLFENLFSSVSVGFLRLDDIVIKTKNVLEMCERNKNLFEDFHEEINSDINKVYRFFKH